jgi:hypothetical protein
MKTYPLFSVLTLLALQTVSGCTTESEDTRETKTIFDPQIQALEKAKQTEGVLKEAEQERAERMREQDM